jgi:hypothetical protein
MAFRHLEYDREARRLDSIDEALGPAMCERGVDGIISTNAIHLHFNLAEALEAQICLSGHGTFFGLDAKGTAARGGDPHAFAASERYVKWVERGERAVEDALAEHGHVGGCDALLGSG